MASQTSTSSLPNTSRQSNQNSKSLSNATPFVTSGANPSGQATVSTAMGTLNITLAQSPAVPTPFFQNPSNVLPIVAFIGVLLTVWFGWRKMKIELAAAAEQARLEREHSLTEAQRDRSHAASEAHQERLTKARREVYLELVSEMQKAQTALSLLPSQDVDKIDTHAGFGGLITATSKVALLGEMSTVKIARELLTAINEALLRLMVFLVPLHELRNKRKFHEFERDKHQAEADTWGVKVGEYVRSFTASKDAVDANFNYDFHYRQAEKHKVEALTTAADFADKNVEYGLAVLSEVRGLSQKLDDLIFSIRSELGLNTSLEELRATSSAMQEAASESLKKLIDTMNSIEKQ